MKIYEDKIYFNCEFCKNKTEKGSGIHYADSWFCNEDCIFEYVKNNDEEIAQLMENDEEENNDNDNPDYDPMDDF